MQSSRGLRLLEVAPPKDKIGPCKELSCVKVIKNLLYPYYRVHYMMMLNNFPIKQKINCLVAAYFILKV